jgi:hypothetical protein
MIKIKDRMKIKKNILLAALTLFLGFGSFAQDSTAAGGSQADDCAKFRSLYFQYIPQTQQDDESMKRQFRDAANFWKKALNVCGAENLDGKFYFNGRYIYQSLAGYEKDSVALQGINDTIKFIYEQRMKVEKDPAWTADYASLLVNEGSTDIAKIDALFAESIHELKSKASATQLSYYFRHLILNKFNQSEGDQKEKARALIIDEYIVLSDYVAQAMKIAKETGNNDGIQRATYARDYLDKYFLMIANDCTILVDVFAKKLNTLPQDPTEKLAKVKTYLDLMDQKDCRANNVYGGFVDTLISLDPSADAYFFGGSYALSTKKTSKAITYFKKAIEMEGEGANKDKYSYYLASAQLEANSYKAAYSTAKSVSGEEYKGKALVICAASIAATANGCGDTTFDRKANYWLANDYINRAIAAGAEGQSSSKYLSNAPSSSDIFEVSKKAGDSILLTCWGESTTIR